MSTSKKIWLGVFTFFPFVFLIAYFIIFFLFFFPVFIASDTGNMDATSGELPLEFLSGFVGLLILTFLMVIMSLVVMIYYIVHVNKNTQLDNNKKIMWTLILIFTNGLGNIAYYFVEIIPLKKPNPQ